MEFINQNNGFFSILFSAVVAIATVIYAILTWKLVEETRKIRKIQTEPKISIDIQPKEDSIHFIDMIIQNIGLGPAYNIKFTINPDFENIKGNFYLKSVFLKMV